MKTLKNNIYEALIKGNVAVNTAFKPNTTLYKLISSDKMMGLLITNENQLKQLNNKYHYENYKDWINIFNELGGLVMIAPSTKGNYRLDGWSLTDMYHHNNKQLTQNFIDTNFETTNIKFNINNFNTEYWDKNGWL